MPEVASVFTPSSDVWSFILRPDIVDIEETSLRGVVGAARRTQACFFRADKQNPLSRTVAYFPDHSNPAHDQMFILMTKQSKRGDVCVAHIPGKKRLKISLMIKRGVLNGQLPPAGFKPFVVTIKRLDEVVAPALLAIPQIRADHIADWNAECAKYARLKGCTRVAVPEHPIWSEDGNKLYHVQPYYPVGDLLQYVYTRRFKEELSVDARVKLFGDVVLGTYELHQRGFAHLDLKSANILLERDGEEGLRGFVGDLDTLTELDGEFDGWHLFITKRYRPPECAHAIGEEQDKKAYDAWGLGCILYEMMACEIVPDELEEDQPDIRTILTDMKDRMTGSSLACLKPLAVALLQEDPTLRPSLTDLLHYLAPENRARLTALKPDDALWEIARPSKRGSAASSSSALSPPSARRSGLSLEEPDDGARSLVDGFLSQ